MAIPRLGSSPGLLIVCCKRWNEVAICQSSRSGKRTCSQIIRVLEPLKRSNFSKGPVCYCPAKNQIAASSEKSSTKTVVASLRILLAPSSLQLPRWAKTELFLSRNHHRSWCFFQLFTSSGNCRIGYMNLAGLGGEMLNLERLNSTRSSVNSVGGSEWQEISCANQQRFCVLQPGWLPLSAEFPQS